MEVHLSGFGATGFDPQPYILLMSFPSFSSFLFDFDTRNPSHCRSSPLTARPPEKESTPPPLETSGDVLPDTPFLPFCAVDRHRVYTHHGHRPILFAPWRRPLANRRTHRSLEKTIRFCPRTPCRPPQRKHVTPRGRHSSDTTGVVTSEGNEYSLAVTLGRTVGP